MANLNCDSYTTDNPFYPDYEGECTWYAWGRFNEVHELELPCRKAAKYWHETDLDYPFALCDKGIINSKSVACFTGLGGHVIFIESVYTDGSFKYSESNCEIHSQGEIQKAKNMTAYINEHAYNGDKFTYKGCIYKKK